MGAWGKRIVAAAALLLLTGCLWGPGKFTSDLALRKNGTFVLDYRGEIMMQLPQDMASIPEPWSNDKARCHQSGVVTVDGVTIRAPVVAPVPKPVEDRVRTCTAEELAESKAWYENRAASKRQESEQMAKMFGLPGQDDESNRRFAANLMKYKGWRSVAYKGKGVFDVDYHFEGRIDQDFVFPLMPDADFIVPFVAIRRRNDGSVLVTAPALTGGAGPFGARAAAMGLPDKSDGPKSRAEGRFTILTDGEILTNNSEDGPAPHPAGRQVHWDVGPGTAKVPEMLVKL